MRSVSAVLLGAAALFGCAPSWRSGPGLVPVSDADGAPSGCKPIGRVHGSTGRRPMTAVVAENAAIEDLKGASALSGGNFVRVERVGSHASRSGGYRGMAEGMAYVCATKRREPPAVHCVEDGRRLVTCSLGAEGL